MHGTMDARLEGLEMTSPAIVVRNLLGWADERGVLHPPDDDGQPGRVTIADPDDEVVRLFGATISLGEKTMELETARIVGDVDELHTRAVSLADDAPLRIALAQLTRLTLASRSVTKDFLSNHLMGLDWRKCCG